ncbi:hypothetical protein MMC10_007599 [Thelotrema lepadinum]|nr:hypothetical protein [Thelotrema lepadinum]
MDEAELRKSIGGKLPLATGFAPVTGLFSDYRGEQAYEVYRASPSQTEKPPLAITVYIANTTNDLAKDAEKVLDLISEANIPDLTRYRLVVFNLEGSDLTYAHHYIKQKDAQPDRVNESYIRTGSVYIGLYLVLERKGFARICCLTTSNVRHPESPPEHSTTETYPVQDIIAQVCRENQEAQNREADTKSGIVRQAFDFFASWWLRFY